MSTLSVPCMRSMSFSATGGSRSAVRGAYGTDQIGVSGGTVELIADEPTSLFQLRALSSSFQLTAEIGSSARRLKAPVPRVLLSELLAEERNRPRPCGDSSALICLACFDLLWRGGRVRSR